VHTSILLPTQKNFGCEEDFLMKTLAALSGAGLLLLVGCGDVTTKTFVASQAVVPADDDPDGSQDFNADGEVDNEINGVGNALSLAGLDLEQVLNDAIDGGTVLIAADVSAKDFNNDEKKVTVNAFLATAATLPPKFDGTDVIDVSAGGQIFAFGNPTIINGNLATDQSDFVFALPLAANAAPTLLAFKQAKLSGNVSADIITGGVLSGVIDSIDFAVALGDIGSFVTDLTITASEDANGGTKVDCTADVVGNRASADCDAGQVCTAQNAVDAGVCVDSTSATLQALDFLDGNDNGVLDVSFNAATKDFDVNELSLLFATTGPLDTASPVGALGSLFSLDLKGGDGVKDSMPLGLKFDGVAAISSATTK
jgi:hypothetical protein